MYMWHINTLTTKSDTEHICMPKHASYITLTTAIPSGWTRVTGPWTVGQEEADVERERFGTGIVPGPRGYGWYGRGHRGRPRNRSRGTDGR
jgi:hypothetical protein